MEGEQPYLGDLLTMVNNHLLTGMILQVRSYPPGFDQHIRWSLDEARLDPFFLRKECMWKEQKKSSIWLFPSWNSKQPAWNGWKLWNNQFSCKDSKSSNWTTIYKWMFQVSRFKLFFFCGSCCSFFKGDSWLSSLFKGAFWSNFYGFLEKVNRASNTFLRPCQF